MTQLHRPYIPMKVRAKVLMRQALEHGRPHAVVDILPLTMTAGRIVAFLLQNLFPGQKAELHHRPALVNRQWNRRRKDYIPPANDPNFLVYLAEEDHDIETRVRGQGAELSDLGKARKEKRVAKNRALGRGAAPVVHKIARKKRRKSRWASRPLKSVSRWPEKGSRKFHKTHHLHAPRSSRAPDTTA